MIFPSPVRFTVLPVFPMWPWSAFWKTVLGRFLREFTCDRPDLFKRSPVNRHAVLKEMAGDPELQKWREKYLDIYPQKPVPVSRAAPVAREWREIPRTEPDPEIPPDNSYRNYL